MNKSFLLPTAGLLLLCAAWGCSSEIVHEVTVTGKVTIDGQPIPQGSVTFIAADGKSPAGGGVIEDGKYTAQVPPGEKIILVLGNKVVGKRPDDPSMPNSPMVDKLERMTPPTYNAQHLTPLTATIADKPNQTVDLELSSDVAAR